jgi:hypothetical protein
MSSSASIILIVPRRRVKAAEHHGCLIRPLPGMQCTASAQAQEFIYGPLVDIAELPGNFSEKPRVSPGLAPEHVVTLLPRHRAYSDQEVSDLLNRHTTPSFQD